MSDSTVLLIAAISVAVVVTLAIVLTVRKDWF